MIPILDKRCPQCGYLTLCELNQYMYCLSNSRCNYCNKDIKPEKISYQNDYTPQQITDIIIEYLDDTGT